MSVGSGGSSKFIRSMSRIDSLTAVLINNIHVVGILTGSFHTGRTHRHTRYHKSPSVRFLFEESVDDVGGYMPLEHVAIYNGYMAGCKGCRDLQA